MAKRPQFRVERYGDRFAVVDTIAIKIYEFASREAAELECDARNGARRQRTTEPPELPILREKLRKQGFLSPGELETFNTRCANELLPAKPAFNPQLFVKALPKFMRAWATELARRCRIDDAQRRSMTTDEVIADISTAGDIFLSAHRVLNRLDSELRPIRWGRLEDEGFQGVLVVHYLSNEPARLKAEYLGLSERGYFRKLEAGHRWLAPCLAQFRSDTNYFDFDSAEEATEQHNADSECARHDDNDHDFYIDRDDWTNLTFRF